MAEDTPTEVVPLGARLRYLVTHPHRAMEVARYGAVGLFNAGLYFGLYAATVTAGGAYWVAAVMSFLIASSIGYWLHEHFTFRGRRTTLTGLVKWLCAQSGATLLNVGLLTLAIHELHLHEIVAQLILLPFLPAATYLLGRRWVFARAEIPPSLGEALAVPSSSNQ
jgi:putative flippase GtrA